MQGKVTEYTDTVVLERLYQGSQPRYQVEGEFKTREEAETAGWNMGMTEIVYLKFNHKKESCG